jgi:hypothetical protein
MRGVGRVHDDFADQRQAGRICWRSRRAPDDQRAGQLLSAGLLGHHDKAGKLLVGGCRFHGVLDAAEGYPRVLRRNRIALAKAVRRVDGRGQRCDGRGDHQHDRGCDQKLGQRQPAAIASHQIAAAATQSGWAGHGSAGAVHRI